MSYSTTNSPEIHRLITSRIRDYFNDRLQMISEGLARRSRYQQTVHELSQFSDRDLRDFGIARYDIRRLARENSK